MSPGAGEPSYASANTCTHTTYMDFAIGHNIE